MIYIDGHPPIQAPAAERTQHEWSGSRAPVRTNRYAMARFTAGMIVFLGYLTMACSVFALGSGSLTWILVFGGGAIIAGVIQVAAGQMLVAVLDGVESLNTMAARAGGQ